MAITFVAAGTNGDNNTVGSGNPTAPGIPAGMAAGDFMYLPVHSSDNVTTSTPVGWTLKQAQNAGTGLRQTIFWRRWQSGDAAPTIAHAAGDACQARIYGFRGVSTTAADPIEAIATQTGTANATVTAASITTLSDNAAVVGAWAEECALNTSGSPTWASYSGTNPTFAEIGDNGVDNLNANELGVGVAWGTCTPAGTVTGTRTAVVTNAAAVPTNIIGTLLALTADVPAGGSQRSVMLPLTGLQIPGQPAVAPMQSGSAPDRSTFDVVTPLPISQFVHPLSLVLGVRLFPAPQPIQAPPGTTDVTLNPSIGVLILSSDIATPAIAVTPTVGTLALSSDIISNPVAVAVTPSIGTLTLSGNANTPAVAVTPSIGTLVLGADAPTISVTGNVTVTQAIGTLTLSGNANTPAVAVTPSIGTLTLAGLSPGFAFQVTPSIGVLSLSADTNTPQITLAPTIGTLVLAGFTTLPSVSSSPPAGILSLQGGANTTSGGTQTSTADDEAEPWHYYF